jgi:hypothetical protein
MLHLFRGFSGTFASCAAHRLVISLGSPGEWVATTTPPSRTPTPTNTLIVLCSPQEVELLVRHRHAVHHQRAQRGEYSQAMRRQLEGAGNVEGQDVQSGTCIAACT